MSLAPNSLVAMEFACLLLISLIFSLLYEMDSKGNPWSGVVAMISWFILGAFYFVVYNEYSTAIISLLFVAIGVIYLIRWFIDVVKMEDAVDVLKNAETF